MIPTTMTVDAVFTGASGVVSSYFGALILLVAVIALGIWAVRFVIRQTRKSVGGKGGSKRRHRR